MVLYKEFKLIDYFNISYGKFVKQNKVGKIPYITTSAFNNGIGGSVEGEPMFKGNCITIASDGSVGSTFYQEHPFSASNIVVVLEPKDKTPLNRYNAQFLATKIRIYAEQKYDYGKKYSVNRVRDTSLKLPVTEYGEVDWEYMEEYIKQKELAYIGKLNQEFEQKKELLIELIGEESEYINIEELPTAKFKVKELFTVSGTKSSNKGDLVFTEDGINFVGRTNEGNGIQGTVEKMKHEPNEGNTITISQVGTIVAKYQSEPYYTSQNIAKLENSNLDRNTGLYMASIINKALILYEGYNTPKLTDIKEIELKLPVRSLDDTEPDWETMEDYVNGIKHLYKHKEESNHKEKLELLYEFTGWAEQDLDNIENLEGQ